MNDVGWEVLLQEWLNGPEQPCVEWKRNNADPERIGEYISALANTAALEGRPCGYMVWGIDDVTRGIVGTTFDPHMTKAHGNQALILWLTSQLHPSVPFEFHPFVSQGQRMLALKVPRAAHTPVRFKDFEYLRVDSHVVKGNRHPERMRLLWQRLSHPLSAEWSGEGVTHDWSLLDSLALADGRRRFVKKQPRLADEVLGWSDERFLSELRVVRGGLLTRAALLLFGKPASVSWLGGVSPRLTWRLQDSQGVGLDYAHFEPPFVLTADDLIGRIRRLTVRILPPRQLAPLELSNYDDWVIREALLNCIAHQDYLQGGRVVVTERPDTLSFFNYAVFLPGSVDRVLAGAYVEGRYRNPCLADAMLKIDLIDTAGTGIKLMYRKQRERYFPMPDFKIETSPPSVQVQVYGREIDSAFTSMMFQATDLSLEEVIALDFVQKKQPIHATVTKRLRAKGLIEGQGRKLWISGRVARLSGQEVAYTLERGLDAQHYKGLILGLLKLGPQRRLKIDQLLLEKLPSSIASDKRKTYVKSLLREMATRDGTIETDGGKTKAAKWRLKPTTGLEQRHFVSQ